MTHFSYAHYSGVKQKGSRDRCVSEGGEAPMKERLLGICRGNIRRRIDVYGAKCLRSLHSLVRKASLQARNRGSPMAGKIR